MQPHSGYIVRLNGETVWTNSGVGLPTAQRLSAKQVVDVIARRKQPTAYGGGFQAATMRIVTMLDGIDTVLAGADSHDWLRQAPPDRVAI